MSRQGDLAKNTGIIAVGTMLPKLTAFITLPILTACLSKTEYGTYDLINTLVSLILPIATLRIEQGAFRFLLDCRNDKDEATKVVSTMLIFILPVALFAMLVFYLISSSIAPGIRLMICVYFALDSIFQVVQQITRGFSKNTLYSLSAIVNAIVNMTLVVLTVRFKALGLFGVLISLSVALLIAIIILVAYGGLISYFSFKSFSKVLLKKLLNYSWPMVPNSLSLWVMNLSDRFLITIFLGLEANAIYAVANKIPQLLNSIQGSFVYAWQENASLAFKDTDKTDYYSSVFDDVFCLLAGLLAGLIAFTPLLFKIFIHGDYEDAYYQMPILFLAMFASCLSSFLGGIYVAHKKTASVGITTMVAAATNFIINILLVRKIGIYAGSISTLVSYTILVLYRMVDILKFQPIKYKVKKCIGCIVALIIFGCLSYVRMLYTDIINLILGIAFAFIINRKIVILFVNKIFKLR